MHHALTIPELLLNIFTYCESSQGLFDCALVCTTFSGPALETLWKRPIPLPAILSQFGRDVLPMYPFRCTSVDTRAIDFGRDVYPSDWSRVIAKAENLTSLTYFETPDALKLYPNWAHANNWPCGDRARGKLYPRPTIPRAIFHELAYHKPVFHILPNLGVLDWTSDDLYCALMFISPSVRELSLCSSVFIYGFFEEVQSRVKELGTLHKLSITGRKAAGEQESPRLEYGTQLSKFFASQSGLRHVRLERDFVSASELEVLGGLPNLESLEIIGTLLEGVLAEYMTIGDRTPNLFRSLRSLDMTFTPKRSTKFPEFISNPRYISSPILTTLKVTFHSNSASDVHTLFSAVAERWPGLQTLRFKPNNEFYDFIESDVKMADVYQKPHYVSRVARSFITDTTLQPILALAGLQELVIEWPYELKLDRKALEEMVHAWPEIEMLYLAPVPFFILPSRPCIKLEDLQIMTGAKKLKRLAMFVDAVPLRTRERRTNQEREMRQIEFDPGRSWISDSAYPAKRLVEMFDGVNLPSDLRNRDTRWGKVARELWARR